MLESTFLVLIGVALAWSVFLFSRSTDPDSFFYIEDAQDIVTGAVWAATGFLLYVIHYADRMTAFLGFRKTLRVLDWVGSPDNHYDSSIALAIFVAILYVPRMLVYTKVAKRDSLRKVNSLVAPYLALITAAVSLWFVLRSVYGLGFFGDVVLGLLLSTTIVLGLVGAVGALVVLGLEELKAGALHVKRLAVPLWTALVKILILFAKFRKDLALSLRDATSRKRSNNQALRLRVRETEQAAELELGRTRLTRSRDALTSDGPPLPRGGTPPPPPPTPAERGR